MDPRTREFRQIKGLYMELMTRIVKLEAASHIHVESASKPKKKVKKAVKK